MSIVKKLEEQWISCFRCTHVGAQTISNLNAKLQCGIPVKITH